MHKFSFLKFFLKSSLLRDEQTISISVVGFADAHLCCYLRQTFHTHTHTHTHTLQRR